MDIEALLLETGTEPPCGPNLEYDPAVLELERLMQVRPEQEFGDTVIPAEEPNWDVVARQAAELLSRTKDLRIAVVLLRCLTRKEHLQGLSDGVTLLSQLLARFWKDVHPVLDPDDGDATARMNALSPLSDSQSGQSEPTVLRDVREAFVVNQANLGRITVRDILTMQGKLQPLKDQVVPSTAEIQGTLAAAIAANVVSPDMVRAMLVAIDGMSELLTAEVGAENAPGLGGLRELVAGVLEACESVAPLGAPEGVGAPALAAAAAGAAPMRAAAAPGEISSREDAIAVLEKVCHFLEYHEPGHPAPLLLRRAQRLLSKNFVEIIEDLVPDSLAQIRNLAGVRDG